MGLRQGTGRGRARDWDRPRSQGWSPESRGPGDLPVPVPVLSAAPAAWLPALQLLRRGSKAVTRHWKAMHFQRQKLLALTEYLPPRPAVPPRCQPRHSPKEQQVRHSPCGHWDGGFIWDWAQSLNGAGGKPSWGVLGCGGWLEMG